jgi:predicted nucleotidyltransferase
MDLAAIERAIVDTAGAEPGVVAAYLFGSVAAGRAHRESDVDIAVLLDWATFPTPAARFEARLRMSRTSPKRQAITHARAIVEFAAAQMA